VNDRDNSSTQPSSSPSEPTEFQVKREAARKAAVEALTAAARLRHPDNGQLDFAEFAAHVLASVAANVGGVDRLLAGRPGSWEADKVGDLLYSTVGHDEEYLLQHRSEPVVIHLNVHRLTYTRATRESDGTRMWASETPCETELDEVWQRYAALSEDAYTDETFAAEEAGYAAIRAKWSARYAAYAEAFTDAIRAEAAAVEGLNVPVRVEAVTEADEAVDDSPSHPDDVDYDDPAYDPVAVRLWDAALAAVPVPADDQWPATPAEE
jgi:hypothetical protein